MSPSNSTPRIILHLEAAPSTFLTGNEKITDRDIFKKTQKYQRFMSVQRARHLLPQQLVYQWIQYEPLYTYLQPFEITSAGFWDCGRPSLTTAPLVLTVNVSQPERMSEWRQYEGPWKEIWIEAKGKEILVRMFVGSWEAEVVEVWFGEKVSLGELLAACEKAGWEVWNESTVRRDSKQVGAEVVSKGES